MTVVGNGVEGGFLESCRREVASSRRTPRDLLVYSGNTAAYHGFDLLFAALALVRRERPGARLSMIVSGPTEALRREAARQGVADAIDIEPPEIGSLPARLVAADVAVNPRPRAEGLPLKVLNYMAAARPTVAFQGSAGPLDDGVTGLLAGEVSPEAFARAVLRLLDDPALAARLGLAAQEAVARRHTWGQVALELEALYAALATPRAEGGPEPAARTARAEGGPEPAARIARGAA
jgi:glycosyltransferase involved in cell wall biosynthesis